MRTVRLGFITIAAFVILAGSSPASAQPVDLGQGWLPEFNHAASQLIALAEATPAEKFDWRPAPGVRSVAEVYMHVALGNYFLLRQAGIQVPVDLAKLPQNPEKSISAKAEVVKFLKESLDAVRSSYTGADRQKKVQFFGKEATADGVLLRLLVHNHEHMGQAIAYARMNGVAPPWSKGGGD